MYIAVLHTHIHNYIPVAWTSYVARYVATLTIRLYRNELITNTWLQNPNKRPTFAVIVQNLSNICNDSNPDEDCSSSGYISVITK